MKAGLRLRIRRYTTAAVGVLFAFALVVFPKTHTKLHWKVLSSGSM